MPGTIESTILTASLHHNDLSYLLFPVVSELCPPNNMQVLTSVAVSNYAGFSARRSEYIIEYTGLTD